MDIKSIQKNIKNRLSCIRKQSERGKAFTKNIRVFYSWNLRKIRWDNYLEVQFNESSYYIKEKHDIWKFVHAEKNIEHEELIFTDKTKALEYFEKRVNEILKAW